GIAGSSGTSPDSVIPLDQQVFRRLPGLGRSIHGPGHADGRLIGHETVLGTGYLDQGGLGCEGKIEKPDIGFADDGIAESGPDETGAGEDMDFRQGSDYGG